MTGRAVYMLRGDTAANWASANPVLGLCEPGIETDTRKIKYGNGATAWNSLEYATAAGTFLTRIAGEALGGHRGVYIGDDGLAWLAGPASGGRRLAGLTSGAASLGAAAAIQTGGEMIEPSWAWTGDDPVWLTAGGILTQTTPTSGLLIQAGIPTGPTSLRVSPQVVAQLA